MKKIDNSEIQKLEVLYKSNKLDELESKIKKLLKIVNNNIILLNILGVVYLKKNFFRESEEIFIKILKKNSKDQNAKCPHLTPRLVIFKYLLFSSVLGIISLSNYF